MSTLKGDQVELATTTSQGVVLLATNGGTTPGTVVQADDSRLAAGTAIDTTRWVGIGAISSVTALDGAWIAPAAGRVVWATLHRRLAGTGGTTTVDLLVNGTSILTSTFAITPGMGNDALDIKTNFTSTPMLFSQYDRFTVNVTGAETGGAKDLDLTMEVIYT